MSYGQHKATASFSKIYALRDYHRVCQLARQLDRVDVIKELPQRAGHKTIDRISGAIVISLGMNHYETFAELFAAELGAAKEDGADGQ